MIAREHFTRSIAIFAAGGHTAFDHTYEIRDPLVQNYVDPGSRQFTNFFKDCVRMLRDDGIAYSEQSTSVKKLEQPCVPT